MNSSGRAFTLALLMAAALDRPTAPAQQGESPVRVVANVTAEDLLAQPVGANWTSYNGDYTGRRYSSLNEVKPENVARLRAAWVFHPGIPNDSRPLQLLWMA